MLSATVGNSPRARWLTVLVAGVMGGLVSHTEASTMGNDTKARLAGVPQATWQKLASMRIYFGHQSVGDNILAGLGEILAANPHIKLNVRGRDDLATSKTPSLFHSYVGVNELPQTKNDAFANVLHEKLHGSVDMAFFKYCYIDIGAATDPVNLFQTYKKTMDELKRQNPDVTFFHITSPLTTTQTGWKAMVKSLLGKTPAGLVENARRHQFNELLRLEYVGKEPLFDLAKLEATRPDGSLATYKYEGHEHLSLVPEYTDDGGHLNEVGRRHIAENFLLFLAEQVNRERR